jgi:hypothetical protein
MLKAKHIIDLIPEEYYTRIKAKYAKDLSFEVFVNPSTREKRDLFEMVKFIADLKEKKVYVWNEYGLLHQDFWQSDKSRNLYHDTLNRKTILGYASNKGGKLVMNGFDGGHFVEELLLSFKEKSDAEKFVKSISWINKYIDLDNRFDKWIEVYF